MQEPCEFAIDREYSIAQYVRCMSILKRCVPLVQLLLISASPLLRWPQMPQLPDLRQQRNGGDVTLIDGATQQVVATIPVGKRPRGIHASPDGRTLYVALERAADRRPAAAGCQWAIRFSTRGTTMMTTRIPTTPPTASAWWIWRSRKFVKKISAGTDPEQFAVSADGKHLFISNEDVGTMSITNVETGKVEHIVPVAKEPEGVAFAPDQRTVYVTCETNGDIFAIDVASHKVAAHFTVPAAPRNVAFLPDGSRGFIPSESSGQMQHVRRGREQSAQDASPSRRLAADGTGDEPRRQNPLCHHRPRRNGVGDRHGEIRSRRDLFRWASGRGELRFSPDGQLLFVANGPSDDVSVVDVAAKKEIAPHQGRAEPVGRDGGADEIAVIERRIAARAARSLKITVLPRRVIPRRLQISSRSTRVGFSPSSA